MGNPFLNGSQANVSPQNINLGDALDMFKQMMNMGSNPEQIINLITTQNPQLANVFNEIKKSGLPPLEYAKKMALQRNINVNPMIEQMMNITRNK